MSMTKFEEASLIAVTVAVEYFGIEALPAETQSKIRDLALWGCEDNTKHFNLEEQTISECIEYAVNHLHTKMKNFSKEQ